MAASSAQCEVEAEKDACAHYTAIGELLCQQWRDMDQISRADREMNCASEEANDSGGHI